VGHVTNRKAFRDADVNEPLFRLYTLLVATELTIKDSLNSYPHSHDLRSLIETHIGSQLPAGLAAQLTALERALSALRCTHKGSSSPVLPTVYPGIRYVRLERDGFQGETRDQQVADALLHALGLIRELATNGIVL